MLLHLNQEEQSRSAQGLLDWHHPFIPLLHSALWCDSPQFQSMWPDWQPGVTEEMATGFEFCPLTYLLHDFVWTLLIPTANKRKPVCVIAQSSAANAELTPNSFPSLYFLSPGNHVEPRWPDRLDFGIRKVLALTVPAVSQVTLGKQLNPGFIFNKIIYNLMIKLVPS